MYTLSLGLHTVLSKECLSGLPDDLQDLLRELATAANEASLALQQAHLLEVRALATNDGDDYAERATVRQRLADDLVGSAMSYRDQLVAVYSRVTADYAAVAVRVASRLLAGEQPSAPTGGAVTPSRILTKPADNLPLVQVYSEAANDDAIADQNVELRQAYAAVTSIIADRMTDADPGQYDDPRAAALRTSTDIDLLVEFPAALHGYAAAVTWAIAVMIGGLGRR